MNGFGANVVIFGVVNGEIAGAPVFFRTKDETSGAVPVSFRTFARKTCQHETFPAEHVAPGRLGLIPDCQLCLWLYVNGSIPLDARSVALVGLSYALVACLWWVNRRRGRARQDDKP